MDLFLSNFYWIFTIIHLSSATRGKFAYLTNETEAGKFTILPTYLYKGGYVAVSVVCATYGSDITTAEHSKRLGDVQLSWVLKQLTCMEEMYPATQDVDLELLALKLPRDKVLKDGQIWEGQQTHPVVYQASLPRTYPCGERNVIIPLDEASLPAQSATIITDTFANSTEIELLQTLPSVAEPNATGVPRRVAAAWSDGMYHFAIALSATNGTPQFQAKVLVEMRNPNGLLSAKEWPQLPLSLALGLVYLAVATAWLVVWARSQQHTRPVHAIIGMVAVTGAVSHTLTFIQLSTINSDGQGVVAILWFARVLHAIQLAAMGLLLMVVAVGYQITTPELGRCQKASMGSVATLQFLLDVDWHVLTDETLQLQYAFPEAAKAVLILKVGGRCLLAGWVAACSCRTALHLRQGRHTDKLASFTVFMATCALAFIANAVVLGMGMNWMKQCRTTWMWEWLYGGVASMCSILLLIVLLVLWRPVDVAHTYAFTPLGTDENENEVEDDDDEEIQFEKSTMVLQPL